MEIKKLEHNFTVCKIASERDLDLTLRFCFIAKTEEEVSLVCPTEDVPGSATAREDGWKAFRIQGVLDFSLLGILSRISGILAENKISVFVVSTYNTDYFLVKNENFARALAVLEAEGYSIQ